MELPLELGELTSRQINATYSVYNKADYEEKKYSRFRWVKVKTKKGAKRHRWVKVYTISITYILTKKMSKQIADEIDKDILAELLKMAL